MIGKVWIFITAFSFITYVHYAQPACMPNDLKTHLDDCLLEEHMFEMKVFSSETKEHELLSIINTLCSTWTKNREKDINKIRVLETFEIMLNNFSENVDQLCVKLNCTDAYTVSTVNATVFGDMYSRSCNGSVSDLKCPSKGTTTIRPNAVESTTFFTMVDSVTTAHKRTTSLTTVSPDITTPESLTEPSDFMKNIFICVLKMNEGLTGVERHEVSSEPTESIRSFYGFSFQALKDGNQKFWSTVKMFSGALAFSLLLNVVLFLLVLNKYLKKSQTNIRGEVSLLTIQGVDN